MKERASARCLRAALDAALESSDLLAHVGGAVQSDCLGYPRLKLVGSSMQGPGQGNALLVFGLIEGPCDSEVLATYFQPFLSFP